MSKDQSDHPVIRTFSYHCRQKYGYGVGKIPLDLGQPCPNRKRGGCIFCRPASFTPSYLQKNDDFVKQVEKGKKQLHKSGFRKYFGYFQQETVTSITPDILLPCFESVLADADCIGLIISTRPDYVHEDLLQPLKKLVTHTGKECLFELGLQSAHNRSLQLLNRNHSFEDFHQAVRHLQEAECFEIGAHLIFGIPGESKEDMIASVRTVCALGVDALKLHHLQVIRDTSLHDLYQQGEIRLFSQEEYTQFLLEVLPYIPCDVTLHRLWTTSHPDLLVAPKWNVLAGRLSSALQKKMVEDGLFQGQKS